MKKPKPTSVGRHRGSGGLLKSKSDRKVKLATDISSFRNIIVDRIVMMPLVQLTAHTRKTRAHTERLIAALMGAFHQFGYLIPIVIDENGVILAGDARVEAARRLGITELPCIRVDHLSEAEKRAFKVADNRLAELADWDFEELKIELDDLAVLDFNMDSIGFTTPEVDFVAQQIEMVKPVKQDEADKLPEDSKESAVTEPGDIWQLGKHRFTCGSALDPVGMLALMEGRQARMVMTDAPYNVAVQGFVSGLGKVTHREFAMASGEMSDEEFFDLLVKASRVAAEHLVDGGLFFGFIDWRGLALYLAALKACGLAQINLCIWNKGTGGMGSLYRSQHEICVVFKDGKAPHVNNVQLGSNGRYRTNLWDFPGMSSFGKGRDEALAMHPTVKPVAMLVEAIKDVTQVNDIVIDTFLGSGSTLIAAQKCGRVCYGMEIDPHYADTIIRRFEAFTGMEAVHAATGKTFAEIKVIREAEKRDAIALEANASAEAGEAATAVVIRKRSRAAPEAEVLAQTETADV